MSNNRKITSLAILLLLLIVAIVGLLAVCDDFKKGDRDYKKYAHKMDKDSSEEPKSQIVYIETYVQKEVSTKKIIVSDKYVGPLDANARIVTISADGEAYSVQGGAVLVSDMVVSVDDNSYDVLRINDYEKSVSSN